VKERGETGVASKERTRERKRTLSPMSESPLRQCWLTRKRNSTDSKTHGVTFDVEERKVIMDDDMWDLMRSEFTHTHTCVKEEMSSSSAITAHKQGGKPSPQQQRLIQDMARGAQTYDPAQHPPAMQTWEHKVQRLSVEILRFTHNKVTEHFRHGPHKGMKVTELTRLLRTGGTTPEKVTPLVVVLHKGKHNVVFGNRRLKALKDFDKISKKKVFMPCIVHRLEEAPKELWAKFVASSTTDNSGLDAAWSRRS